MSILATVFFVVLLLLVVRYLWNFETWKKLNRMPAIKGIPIFHNLFYIIGTEGKSMISQFILLSSFPTNSKYIFPLKCRTIIPKVKGHEQFASRKLCIFLAYAHWRVFARSGRYRGGYERRTKDNVNLVRI